MLVMYYAILGLVFYFGGISFLGYTSNTGIPSGNVSAAEIDKGGLFSTGVDFGRFALLLTLGIGLPASVPAAFQIIFAIWQSSILMLTIGFIISSIWNG